MIFRKRKRVLQSSYERHVADCLDREGIRFISQYQIPSCIYWRFDFFIPAWNLIIEVHGQQHYEYVKKFHKTKADLKKQQKRDVEKMNCCIQAGHKYYVISYHDIKNTEKILKKLEPAKIKKLFYSIRSLKT